MQSDLIELLVVGVICGISGMGTGLKISETWRRRAWERGEAYGRCIGTIQGLGQGVAIARGQDCEEDQD